MTQRQIPAVAPKCVVALLFQRHQAHKIVSTKSKVRNSTKHYTGPCRKKKTLQGKAKRKNKKREFGGGGGGPTERRKMEGQNEGERERGREREIW